MKPFNGKHIPTCAILEIRPCPSNKSLHGEKPDEHWFSGWPGAYCMKCGDEDKVEICIGGVCECPCHLEFWAEYEQAMKETPPTTVNDMSDSDYRMYEEDF